MSPRRRVTKYYLAFLCGLFVLLLYFLIWWRNPLNRTWFTVPFFSFLSDRGGLRRIHLFPNNVLTSVDRMRKFFWIGVLGKLQNFVRILVFLGLIVDMFLDHNGSHSLQSRRKCILGLDSKQIWRPGLGLSVSGYMTSLYRWELEFYLPLKRVVMKIYIKPCLRIGDANYFQ